MRLALVLLLTLAANAQTTSERAVDLSEHRAGIDPGNVVDLSVQDAIYQFLRQSKDVEAWRLDLESSDLTLSAARGAYDPVIGFGGRYDNKVTPVSSVLGGALDGKLRENGYDFSPSLNGVLPSGTIYQFGTFFNRDSSSSFFVPLVPQYNTGLSLYLEQPLWRGLRIDAVRRGVAVANRGRELSAEQFRARMSTMVAEVSKTYFRVVAAQENLKVQRQALEDAYSGAERSQRIAAQGLLPAVEVLSAKAQATSFEDGFYRALDRWTAAENALKQLILPSKDAPLWHSTLNLVSNVDARSERWSAAGIPIEEALEQALQNRPEMAQAKVAASIAEINTRYSTEQAKPEVNLFVSYSAAGLAGSEADRPNPFESLFPMMMGSGIPPEFIGGGGTAFGQALRHRFPTVSAGLRVSLPIRNRSAEANAALAHVDERRSRNQIEKLELALAAEVRNAAQALASARARLISATESREFAQEDFESQRRKLNAGLVPSIFEASQKQLRLVEAQIRELESRADARIALIEFERVLGRTLDVHGVDVHTN